MRVVFFGTPELAVPSLDAVAGRHEVVAVVCQPDRPQGRSGRPVPPPTKQWADTHGVAVVQPTKLNDGSFEKWLREQAPDIGVLVAYGRILRPAILNVPQHGFLNMHPSLLPRHRGPSPIQTAILLGDDKTGVTIMRLDEGTDTGDILLQREVPVMPDDTTASLSERLALEGATLLIDALDLVARGEGQFVKQDDARATVTRLYQKKDGQIVWSAPARDIHNLVRAALPWPVAHCRFSGEICRIHKTDASEEPANDTPGTILSVERDRIVVATGAGRLSILALQMPGKKAMTTAEFLRGHAVRPGDRFEDL